MLKIIEKDKLGYSIQYKIEHRLELNERNKKYIEKNFNPKLAYKLAMGGYFDLYSLEEYERICLINSRQAYCFARNIKGANIERCQEVACKDPEWAFIFARDIPGANIEECQEVACKKPQYAFMFARDVKGADIKKCQKAACKNSYYAYCFAIFMKRTNMKKSQSSILEKLIRHVRKTK